MRKIYSILLCVLCLSAVGCSDDKDTAVFEWKQDGNWQTLAEPFSLYFKLDHFCGVRPGLFCYATKEPGGQAAFSDFTMRKEETDE